MVNEGIQNLPPPTLGLLLYDRYHQYRIVRGAHLLTQSHTNISREQILQIHHNAVQDHGFL